MFIATGVWPCWKRAATWRLKAQSILERECVAQNYPDGTNAEQSIWYQQFVVDLLLLPWLQAKRLGNPFTQAYRKRMEATFMFVAAMTDNGGHLPRIGDADDGLATGLWGARGEENFSSLMATGAVLFERPALAKGSTQFDAKSQALIGNAGKAQWDALRQQSEATARQFPYGGYYLLGSHWDTRREVRCLVDAGPLGMGALAAHGHADALAVCLHVAGQPVLVDPGTYAYHTKLRWRDYFRSTAAHNTVRLNHADQSQSGGNFLWLRKAQAWGTVRGSDEVTQHFSGHHDGYADSLGARHRREIQYDATAQVFQFRDIIETAGSIPVEQFWHCHPECDVHLTDNRLVILTGQARVTLELDRELQWQLMCGDEERPAGWYSPRFDVKVPAATIVGHGETSDTTEYQTRIKIEF